MTDLICATCGSLAEGYKCAECGEEHGEFEDGHPCGEENFMPKCSVCNEAEVQCSCDMV